MHDKENEAIYMSLEFCFCEQDFTQVSIIRKDFGDVGTAINYSMVK